MSNLTSVMGDIVFLKRDVSDCIIERPFNAIFHLACHPRSMSFINPKRDVQVNINGIVNILEYAQIMKPTVIFTSNSGIYSTSKIPISESTADYPKTPYDLNKLTAEEYLKLYSEAYGVPFVIFRLATVYGPRQRVSPDWKPVVMEFVNRLLSKKAPTIFSDGEQTRDLIFVDDLVEGLTAALHHEEAKGETMILGTGVETSINQLYKTVCNEVGTDLDPKRGPKAIGDIRRMRYDCTKAKQILGWRAETPLEEGIREILRRRDP